MNHIKPYTKRIFIIALLMLVFTAVEYLLLTAEPASQAESGFLFTATKIFGVTLLISTHIFVGWVVLFSSMGIFNTATWQQYEQQSQERYNRYNRRKKQVPHNIKNQDEYANARNAREQRIIRKMLEKTMKT